MLMHAHTPLDALENHGEFIARHIGPDTADEAHMLSVIGAASRQALIDAIGARYASAADTPITRLPDLVGNLDLVYEATGASSVSFETMKVLGTNGVFVFTGVPGRKAPIELDADVLMRNLVLKNQVVFGTVNAGSEAFAAAVRDLTLFQMRWPAAVGALVTGRYPLAAFHDLLVGPAQGIKNVLTFD